ncbi:hypothetical protein D3C71_923500 [compost metagenome]
MGKLAPKQMAHPAADEGEVEGGDAQMLEQQKPCVHDGGGADADQHREGKFLQWECHQSTSKS